MTRLVPKAKRIRVAKSHFHLDKYSVPDSELVYIILHDNENTAAEVTREYIKEQGGTVYEVRAQGMREITFSLDRKEYRFDPNRIFSLEGTEKTLDNYNSTNWRNKKKSIIKAISNVASKLIRCLKGRNIMIAVHNNKDGNFSVRSFKNIAKKIYVNSKMDSDDFFIVNREEDYKYFSLHGYNVAFQDEGENDGSLLAWACNNDRRYINVETRHGEKEKQKEMLNLVNRLYLTEKIIFFYSKESNEYLRFVEKYTETLSIQEKEWYVKIANKTVAKSRQQNSYAIIVNKFHRQLYLYKGGDFKKKYKVTFGTNPVERKIMQDNSTTPEGIYKVLRKNPKSSFYKAFYLNYPNSEDKQRFRRAKREGRIPKDATIGGDIEIHGENTASDWTLGCIAMENSDIDELWSIINIGIPVTIVKYLSPLRIDFLTE
jgi:hypothetical protein